MKGPTIKMAVAVEQRYPNFLKLVSSLLPQPLTPKEIEVLSAFKSVSDGVVTASSRVEVCKIVKITRFNLNNILKSLRDKRFISQPKDSGPEVISDYYNIDVHPKEPLFAIWFVMKSSDGA